MPEYVRVKDPSTGHEYTYTAEQVAVTGLSKGDVIDRPALGPDGRPAPDKPRLPKGEPLAGSQSARRRATKKASGAKSTGVDAGPTSATHKEK